VISLDADEWIEPNFIDRIKAAIADPDAPDAYKTSRRSRFCGRIIRHGGWSPDYVFACFGADGRGFQNDMVHERLMVDGPVTRLECADRPR